MAAAAVSLEWVWCARCTESYTPLALNEDNVVAVPISTTADADPVQFWIGVPVKCWGHRWADRPLGQDEVVNAINVTIEVPESPDGDIVPLRVTLVLCHAAAFPRFTLLHDREVTFAFLTVLPPGTPLLLVTPADKPARRARASPADAPLQDTDAEGYGTAPSGLASSRVPLPSAAAAKASPPIDARMESLEKNVGSLFKRIEDFRQRMSPNARPPPSRAAPVPAVQIGSPLEAQLGSFDLSEQQLAVVPGG